MKTIQTSNEDEFAGRTYGWDGEAFTVTFPTPKTIAKVTQIRREIDAAWDLYQQDAA